MNPSASSASPGSSALLPSAVDYLPLVQRVARRLGRRLPPHVSVDDLVGAGVVGLLEALRRFDPTRTTEFAAFAEFRIKGAILDELRRGDLMARDARAEVKRMEGVFGDLSQRLGTPPSEEELAAAMGCSLSALHVKLERLVPVRISSFDDQAAELSGNTFSPFEQVRRGETTKLLAAALTRLPERQRQVLHLYYAEELTLRQIGVVMEVSESRICQIMAAATLQLRVYLKERDFDG